MLQNYKYWSYGNINPTHYHQRLLSLQNKNQQTYFSTTELWVPNGFACYYAYVVITVNNTIVMGFIATAKGLFTRFTTCGVFAVITCARPRFNISDNQVWGRNCRLVTLG